MFVCLLRSKSQAGLKWLVVGFIFWPNLFLSYWFASRTMRTPITCLKVWYFGWNAAQDHIKLVVCGSSRSSVCHCCESRNLTTCCHLNHNLMHVWCVDRSCLVASDVITVCIRIKQWAYEILLERFGRGLRCLPLGDTISYTAHFHSAMDITSPGHSKHIERLLTPSRYVSFQVRLSVLLIQYKC